MKSKSRISTMGLILFTFVILISSNYGGNDGNPEGTSKKFEAREPFSFEAPVVIQSQFSVEGKGGAISITGKPDANSVTIAGVRSVQADTLQEVEEYLPLLQVDVQTLANEIRVKTIKPLDTTERIYNVDYTIILPVNLKIEIDNVGGLITIDSIVNDIIVKNVAGKVTLVNINGSVTVDLTAGTIESEVALPLNGKIDLKTGTGNINLYTPLNTSAEFSASVFLNRNISVPNLVLQNEVRTSTSLSGTLGNGEGTISLRAAVGGDITMTGLMEDLWFFQRRWNLFSNHLGDLDADTLNMVFANANSPLWVWNGNQFVVHDTLSPGIGYWLYTEIPKLVMPMGTPLNDPEPVLNDLIPGWNLVGIKGDTFLEASAIPNTNSNSIIWTWDHTLHKLISIHDPSLASEERGRLFPGRGYWIFKHTELLTSR